MAPERKRSTSAERPSSAAGGIEAERPKSPFAGSVHESPVRQGRTRRNMPAAAGQVSFMESLMQPSAVRDRILNWSEEQTRVDRLPRNAGAILEAALYRGDLPRREIPALLNATDLTARRATSALLERGVLASISPRARLPSPSPPRWPGGGCRACFRSGLRRGRRHRG